MTQIGIYQIIHTLDGRVLNLEAHVKILRESYIYIYNKPILLNTQSIKEDIEKILPKSRFSIYVRIELNDEGEMSITLEERSIYRGYNLRCVSPSAALIYYDNPLANYPTTAMKSATDLANLEASRLGCDIALRVKAGVVDRAPMAPIVAVIDTSIYTSTDKNIMNVEHALLVEAAMNEGIEIIDRFPTNTEILKADELFYATHHGITAVSHYIKRYYTAFVARRLAEAMNRLSKL